MELPRTKMTPLQMSTNQRLIPNLSFSSIYTAKMAFQKKNKSPKFQVVFFLKVHSNLWKKLPLISISEIDLKLKADLERSRS